MAARARPKVVTQSKNSKVQKRECPIVSPTPEQLERRTAVRVDVPLEVMYSSDSPAIRARIQDLSERGLFIDTNHPLVVGSTVTVSFNLSDGGEDIETLARVAWSAPMMGSGVEFVGLPSVDRKRIHFFVAEVFFATN